MIFDVHKKHESLHSIIFIIRGNIHYCSNGQFMPFYEVGMQ